jgi:hypothetical protein
VFEILYAPEIEVLIVDNKFSYGLPERLHEKMQLKEPQSA